MARDFNDDIVNLVMLVTKIEDEPIEIYFKKVGRDIRALAMKAADRTHNISDMVNAFTVEKMKEYIEETEKYILPQMKKARKMNIEYGDLFVALSAHINAVILPIRKLVEIMEKEK